MLKQFVLKPSRVFTSMLIIMHLLALVSVWLINGAPGRCLALSLLIGISLLYCLYRYALLRDKSAWLSFSINQKRVLINTRGGDEWVGDIMHRTLVTSHCVVLSVSLDERKFPVSQVIFWDAMPVEAFRQLRVRLKYL
ncbi:MAG: hypothetical protein COZ77_02095 [Gallionellales bacterium CG_4_8_14_3_um_filter_54_18]|nr:hypothetical protein [Gallionella sp.]PIX05262.1 MAG: hypothetical protein COZ77_02095 [Gallionellales bacterium CG_4_8_14_3_um_filter_54_18]